MERVSVQSSNLESVGYDEETKILEIEFKGGSVYRYYNVPKDIYDELLEAESKGKYFWRNIRNEFNYKKVD